MRGITRRFKKKTFSFYRAEAIFRNSSHAKSFRVPTGQSKAGVPPRSSQIFEMIPSVRLLTGFHTSRDLVSHPFVNNPCLEGLVP